MKDIKSEIDQVLHSTLNIGDDGNWFTPNPAKVAALIYNSIAPLIDARSQDFAGWIANQSIQGRTYHKLWLDYVAEKNPNNGILEQAQTPIPRETTKRNFAIYKFKDRGGVECSIQKSSASMEDAIWIGANELGLLHFKAGEGWNEVKFNNTIEEHWVANNRMELTQDQVKQLLPILIQFAETGEI